MERSEMLKYLDACDQVGLAIKSVIATGSESVAREVVPMLDDVRRSLMRAAEGDRVIRVEGSKKIHPSHR